MASLLHPGPNQTLLVALVPGNVTVFGLVGFLGRLPPEVQSLLSSGSGDVWWIYS